MTSLRSPAEGLDDDALFAEIVARRARAREENASSTDRAGKAAGPAKDDAGALLGVLLERWRRPAFYVIRRIQQSYRRGSEEDQEELFQDAAYKLLDRGLDQFRGRTDAAPADAPATAPPSEGRASARTFFLRIVKHTAIDYYRRQREELASGTSNADGDEPELHPSEIDQSVRRARRDAERDEAQELYWRAFERLREEHPNEAGAWDLYHHQDLDDHEAVAKALGISVVNSYKRISRAQAHLRLFLLELRDGVLPD